MYENAPPNYAGAMILLFGIIHADDIKKADTNASRLVRALGWTDGYSIEIGKGIRLAEYVSLKPGAKAPGVRLK